MPADHLTRDRRRLVNAIRDLLRSDKCAIHTTQLEGVRKLLVVAAVSHSCLLLERLDRERVRGDDIVGRMLARGHLETWLHGMYLHLGGVAAVEMIAGAFRKQLGGQQRALDEYDATLTSKDDVIGLDFSPLIRQFSDVDEKHLPIKDLANRVVGLMSAQENGDANHVMPKATIQYSLIYKSLSNLGAHPNYWVLDRYLDQGGIFIRVRTHSELPTMLEGATHSAILLTADLAACGFRSFACDVTVFEQIVSRYSQASP